DRRLLTISTEPKARLWDLESRNLINEFTLGALDERLASRSVLLSRDRRLMAMNVQSNVIGVLDTASGNWLAEPLTLRQVIRMFALSEDGHLLATASDSEVQIWNISNDQALCAPVGLTETPWGLRFSEDGRWLACLTGKKVWVMNTITCGREKEFP